MLAGSGEGLTMKNGMAECKYCGHTTSVSPSVRQVSRAYDRHHSNPASRFRALNVLLVVSDCTLIGLQPILVYMSKVDGKFLFDPVSVNFLTELAKVAFAVCMLLFAVRKQHPGEKSLLSPVVILQAARANYLLAVPALLYAINNYLKFIMQLYFNPATVKMLSNLKRLSSSGRWMPRYSLRVLMIALLLKVVMRRRFTIMQWEALGLLLIGISVNQLHTTSTGTTSIAVPVAGIAYAYTLIFVTVPSLASVYNEYALKSQFDTSVHLQNLFLYGYGAFFNLCGIVIRIIYNGTTNFNLVEGHSKATAFLILNNAAQGILSSFFFKYAEVFLREGFPLKRVLKAIGDTILKKYSSTVATIFTGLASAALFGHTLTINFVLGVSIVFISMHQFFSSLPKKDSHIREEELDGTSKKLRHDSSFVNMTAGATEEASHKIGVHSEREPLLPT